MLLQVRLCLRQIVVYFINDGLRGQNSALIFIAFFFYDAHLVALQSQFLLQVTMFFVVEHLIVAHSAQNQVALLHKETVVFFQICSEEVHFFTKARKLLFRRRDVCHEAFNMLLVLFEVVLQGFYIAFAVRSLNKNKHQFNVRTLKKRQRDTETLELLTSVAILPIRLS